MVVHQVFRVRVRALRQLDHVYYLPRIHDELQILLFRADLNAELEVWVLPFYFIVSDYLHWLDLLHVFLDLSQYVQDEVRAPCLQTVVQEISVRAVDLHPVKAALLHLRGTGHELVLDVFALV